MSNPGPLHDWIEALPSLGRYTFTRAEAEARSASSSEAVQAVLRRLKQRGRIVCPRRGFYVVVPTEYRAVGSPPASWFIHELMGHLGHRYYVGLLTAAALYGAGHQQPMVFQIITDAVVRGVEIGRVRIEAHASRLLPRTPTRQLQTETGTMLVSTPESTAFDLVRFPAASGWWSNVATVLGELAESLDPALLLEAAERGAVSEAQRLGYLLALLGAEGLAQPLQRWLEARRTTLVPLRADRPAQGIAPDPRWQVIVNEAVEPDL